jgi:hypothetical protein
LEDHTCVGLERDVVGILKIVGRREEGNNSWRWGCNCMTFTCGELDTVRLGSMELNTVECYEAYDPATCCLFAGSTAFKLAWTILWQIYDKVLGSCDLKEASGCWVLLGQFWDYVDTSYFPLSVTKGVVWRGAFWWPSCFGVYLTNCPHY